MKKLLKIIFNFLGSWGEPKYHHHLLEASAVKLENGELEVVFHSEENQVSRTEIELGSPYGMKLVYKHKTEEKLSYDLFLRVLNSSKEIIATYHTEDHEVKSWFGAGWQRFRLLDKVLTLEYENHFLEGNLTLKNSNEAVLEKVEIAIPLRYECKILEDAWNV